MSFKEYLNELRYDDLLRNVTFANENRKVYSTILYKCNDKRYIITYSSLNIQEQIFLLIKKCSRSTVYVIETIFFLNKAQNGNAVSINLKKMNIISFLYSVYFLFSWN